MNLADLLPQLKQGGVAATMEAGALVADHGPYCVRAEVLPPEGPQVPGREIEGVVRVTCGLPHDVAPHLADAATALQANRLASFGALALEGGEAVVGSRFTLHRAHDTWAELIEPLVLYSMISGAEPILGGLRRAAARTPGRGGESDWTAAELEQVAKRLGEVARCRVEPGVLHAEITLGEQVATLEMRTDRPHPEVGGGLFCLLQMPHATDDVASVCAQLNEREFAAADLPPHIGAWTDGSFGINPAYVWFLPNALRDIPGIAINVGFWSYGRALWADAALRAGPAT